MSLESELLDVISKYGLSTASSKVAGAASVSPKLGGAAAASYIREIITGDVAFDERVLQQVANVLVKGVGAGR